MHVSLLLTILLVAGVLTVTDVLPALGLQPASAEADADEQPAGDRAVPSEPPSAESIAAELRAAASQLRAGDRDAARARLQRVRDHIPEDHPAAPHLDHALRAVDDPAEFRFRVRHAIQLVAPETAA